MRSKSADSFRQEAGAQTVHDPIEFHVQVNNGTESADTILSIQGLGDTLMMSHDLSKTDVKATGRPHGSAG